MCIRDRANGVGLAPFHEAEKDVPPDVRAKLNDIFRLLASGKLDTGVDPVTGDMRRVTGGPLKVALLAPLSGDVAAFGGPTRNGVLMATDEWNQAGGVLGRPIELVVEDSQCSPEPAVNAANKVIDQDGVKFIIGEVCSRASIPVSEIANAKGVVQISPLSTSPAVTVDANGRVKPYTFRACLIDPFQGTVGAHFALKTLKAKTAFIMVDEGNPYTLGLGGFFEEAFTQGGGAIVGKGTYTPNDADFSAILARVAEVKPDVLYLPDYYTIANRVGAQAKERGLTVTMMGGDGWDSPDLDLKAVDGGYFTNHFSAEDPRPAVQEWVKKYQARYGAKPDTVATLAYDAANLLYTAIQNADSDDPAKVKDVLAALKGFEGVSGKISFDPSHNPVKSAVVLRVKDGAVRYVETVNP